MRKVVLVVLLAGLATAALDASVASAGLNVCVKNSNGALRAVSAASACAGNETAHELANTGEVAAQQAEITALTARVDALEALLAGVSRSGDRLVFTGLNLQIVNGTGSTDTENSLGNLIIGYNASGVGTRRNGSHNLVIGDLNSYASHSGFVSGIGNTVSNEFAFVGGGIENTASGFGAFVGGGTESTASGFGAFVAGGGGNTASGDLAFIGGGGNNTASDEDAFVGGGFANTASSPETFVGGGLGNTASGHEAFVGGGVRNTASGSAAFVAGGGDLLDSSGNTASGDRAFVAGGAGKTAGPGICSWIANVNLVPC